MTLSYDAFTDSESMNGDVMRIQRTLRLTPAACSLTGFLVFFTGSEHLIGTYCESREHRVGASRSLLFWVMEKKKCG